MRKMFWRKSYFANILDVLTGTPKTRLQMLFFVQRLP